MGKIRIYTISNCFFCAEAKNHLRRCKIEFEEVDLAKDKGAAEKLIKMGVNATPVIEVDGRLTVGYNAKWVSRELCGKRT